MALSQLLQGLITTKHIRIIDQLAQSYLTGNDYVIAYRTQLGNMVEQHTQIYLAYMMTSPPPGHMTNMYGLISACKWSITTKLDRMIEQHAPP